MVATVRLVSSAATPGEAQDRGAEEGHRGEARADRVQSSSNRGPPAPPRTRGGQRLHSNGHLRVCCAWLESGTGCATCRMDAQLAGEGGRTFAPVLPRTHPI